MNNTSGIRFGQFSRRSVYLLWVLGLILFLVFFCSAMWGQSTFGSVRGTVQDASGAVLPNTDVTLHSEGENNDRSVKSDAAGVFTIENVKPGQYVVHANLDGFSETVMTGI